MAWRECFRFIVAHAALTAPIRLDSGRLLFRARVGNRKPATGGVIGVGTQAFVIVPKNWFASDFGVTDIFGLFSIKTTVLLLVVTASSSRTCLTHEEGSKLLPSFTNAATYFSVLDALVRGPWLGDNILVAVIIVVTVIAKKLV
jgi:hypothetical protein